MWREYFGPTAKIMGIDVDPACAAFGSEDLQVRIGDQSDSAFLAKIAKEMDGQFDIVIDDGSHIAAHQVASFKTLWPLLAQDGIYVVEIFIPHTGMGGAEDCGGREHSSKPPNR